MPLVLLILDYYPLGRAARDGWKRLIIEKSPFLALSLAAGLMGIWSQEAGASIVPVAELPLAGRIHIAARGYLFYVYKLLFPAALAPFYPRELAAGPNFLSLLYIAALSAITALAFYLRKWSRAYISAWAYFAITLLPVIGLLQVGSQAAADRYTYLPGISLAMLVAAGAGMVVMKKRKAFLPALAAVAAISALLSFLTFRQAAVWKDPISLWNRQITLFPQHSYGYMYRGGALINAGRYEEGLADLTVVVDMHGEEKIAYKARGTAYAVAGQYENAIEDFLKAVELDPYDSSTHIELGKAYMHLGDNRNSYLSMKKADRLGDPAALGFLKDLETWGAGPGE
jgi:tetratricopeptide (TPR) repeat protein